jgi:hypothetical protein
MTIPVKCPVCEGKGKVRAGFYPDESLTAAGWVTCRTCNGCGILYGFQGDPPQPYTITLLDQHIGSTTKHGDN